MPMQPVNNQNTSPTQQILPGGCYDTRPQQKCKPSFGDMCREMFTRKPAQCPQDCSDMLKGFMSLIKDLIGLLKDCGKAACEKKCKPKEDKPKECKKCEDPDDSIPNPPPPFKADSAGTAGNIIAESDGGKISANFEPDKIYNLLSDGDLQINAKTAKFLSKSILLDEIGIRFGENQIQMSNKRGAQPTLNGKALEKGTPQPMRITSAVTGKKSEGTVEWTTDNKLKITTPEYSVHLDIGIVADVPDNMSRHIGVSISPSASGVWSDWVDPEGILGNTFDPDSDKLSAIRGNYSEYEVNDGLFGTDYDRNRFNKAPKEFAKDASGNVTEVKAADGTVLWEKE